MYNKPCYIQSINKHFLIGSDAYPVADISTWFIGCDVVKHTAQESIAWEATSECQVLFVCIVALRPKSTAMVMAGQSVPGQA